MIKKNLKIIFPIVLIISLLVAIPQASALFEDKVYDPETETITIRNWINQPIISLQLLENTDQCLVNCSALINITPHRDIDANDEAKYRFDFYDKKNRNALAIGKLKEWNLKKQVIEDYEIDVDDYGTCQGIRYNNQTKQYENYDYSCVTGSHKETRQRIKWKPFILNPSFWKKGESVIVKLEGKKQLGSSVEWIPTIYGFELTEWAWWDSGYDYRYPIINNQTNVYPISVNDTYGINGDIIWSLIGNSSYVYSTESGLSGTIAIANETDEKYWENETSRLGNSPASVWGSNAQGIWHFSEGSGTNVYDSSGNGNNGTLAYSDHWTTSGKFGTAYDFDGTNDYINCGNDVSLNVGDALTIMFWIKRDGTGVTDILIDNRQINDRYGYMVYLTADKINFQLANAGAQVSHAADTSIDTNWHFIAIVWDKTDVFFYLDGVPDGSESASSSEFAEGTGNNTIGVGISGVFYFDGIMDEVRIYKSNTTSDEILQVYNNGINNLTRLGSEEIPIGITVTLVSPTHNTNTTTIEQTFICAAMTAESTLSNITLYVWGSNNNIYYENTTNITGTSNQTNWTTNLHDDTYKWNCLVYDDLGNNSDGPSNFTLIIDTKINVNETYDSEVIETQNTNFTLSIETASISEYNEINATFYYNNTIYGYDNKTIIENITNFIKTITVPNINNNIENASFYWNYNVGNADYNTITKNHTIYKFIISICNATYTTQGLNFTIKNELNQSLINGDLSINFVYWQYGQSSLNKTYDYSGTNKSNYTFCISPENTTIYSNFVAYYSADGYPERRYYTEDAMLTKEVTQISLYLLETDEGMYARFKTVTQYQEAIAKVNVIMEKLISGTYVTIEREETDDSGLATFWVDPDSDYRFTFTKTGYIQEVLTLRPTSTEIYTIIMGVDVEEEEKSMYTGLSYEFSISPAASILNNNTVYNFSFSYISSYWIITNCTFYLKNKSDNSILAQNNSGWLSGSGYILISYNTTNLTGIIAEAVLEENSTYTLTLQTEYTIRFTYEGEFSLKNFFDDLAAFSQAGFNDFSRMIIAFIMIFILTTLICYFTGLANPEGIILFVWAMIGVFSYLGWFYMSYSGIPSGFGDLNKYIIFYIITLTSLGFIIWRHT